FMRRLALTTFFAVAILVGSTFGKAWHGITPLVSTRSDVERLLGKPNDSKEGGVYYDLSRELVVIEFQGETCSSTMGRFGFGWDVPLDKVTFIGIIPKTPMTKEFAGVTSAFKIDDKWGGFVYFDNDDDGFSVEVYDGTVTNIRYAPSNKDDSLKCPRVQ